MRWHTTRELISVYGVRLLASLSCKFVTVTVTITSILLWPTNTQVSALQSVMLILTRRQMVCFIAQYTDLTKILLGYNGASIRRNSFYALKKNTTLAAPIFASIKNGQQNYVIIFTLDITQVIK